MCIVGGECCVLKLPFSPLVESTSATQSHDQATPLAPPTAEQLASIESDTFAPEKFVSHRTSGRSKQVGRWCSVYRLTSLVPRPSHRPVFLQSKERARGLSCSFCAKHWSLEHSLSAPVLVQNKECMHKMGFFFTELHTDIIYVIK